MYGCEVCLTWKIKCNPEVNDVIRKYASILEYLIILGWLFVMKMTQNKDWIESISGINGEQAYFLIAAHQTSNL